MLQCFRRRYLLELGRSVELCGVRALAGFCTSTSASAAPTAARVGVCDEELALGAHLLRAQLVALRSILRRHANASGSSCIPIATESDAALVDGSGGACWRWRWRTQAVELVVGSSAPVSLTLTHSQLARLRCALERAAVRSSSSSTSSRSTTNKAQPSASQSSAPAVQIAIALRVGVGSPMSVVSTYSVATATPTAGSEKLLASLQKLASSA